MMKKLWSKFAPNYDGNFLTCVDNINKNEMWVCLYGI